MDRIGRYRYETIIGVALFEAVLEPLGGGSYMFKAEAQGLELGGVANPVLVKLTVGDDGGSAEVMAEIT